jgi:hypothetical protein
MTIVDSSLSIIILNVNGLNSPIIIHWVIELIGKNKTHISTI